jgi:ectoine hydroxylase-related dioxygenase (phytanoyl-CoA dioxygenase family)
MSHELPYRFEFQAREFDEILACYTEHGFAIVRQMATPAIVEDLRHAVWEVLGAKDPPALGHNRTTPDFVERSERAIRLLDADAYVELNRRMFGTDALTIHRSFGVLKNAGSAAVAWHRDFHHIVYEQPSEPDEFLDAGDHGFRALWYLDGSYPDNGGLWLIPDSHRDDWPGLPGFAFAEGRKSFHRIGEEPVHYEGFDAPEMLPLVVDPGDLVLYSLNTYHAAAPQLEGLRRACAIILRPSEPAIAVPWQETAATREFLAAVPERFASFVTNYVGIDYRWEQTP